MTRVPLALVALFGGMLLACLSVNAPAVRANVLHLEVDVEPEAGVSANSPIIRIHITNIGSESIAFTETFGFEDLYLRIALERLSAETGIDYPPSSQYELFSTPRYRCLSPRETTTVEVPLNGWYHIYGGKLDMEQAVPEPGPYSFGLGPGSYRVRAIYSSPDEGVRRRCRALNDLKESEWVEFEIPERSQRSP